ncbi:phage holin family protein [Clostridium perfringens]|uniref:phage holin family protein n=1 Tax=Clostridium perfringens TaxID=1502 RepID=UPI0008A68E92|nr:phage holin family protein [Clostridium perfringens]AOY53877.1 toxin secretion/phage lysis holin [Clostridium perfringens]EJT5930514.1 phage holin family protein [Clostridium perfringens]EJT6161777.1 phage holin family protein [Clostridium perfringens]EJT6504258.1 phage holin family protein [Clostridium perfringens]MDK0856971.1 phage holin family protein [Clostridium perfringens]
MEKLFDYIKLLVMALGTGLTWLLGVWDMPLITLVIFMILDQLTGVIRGYVNKDLSSDVGLKGIARKCVILIVLIVAVSLDRLLNTGSWMFRTMVAYFYIANEGISLLENCASLGAPIPEKLKNALIQLKEGKKKEPINENA